MFTVAEARALGLPVYVRCNACRAPGRSVPLIGLDPALDLDAAAATGRFRCRACGGRQGMIEPAMHRLIAGRQRLRLSCPPCGKDQAMTAAQACSLFGLSTPFDDLRRRLACRKDCRLTVQAMEARARLDGSCAAVMTLPPDGLKA